MYMSGLRDEMRYQKGDVTEGMLSLDVVSSLECSSVCCTRKLKSVGSCACFKRLMDI